MPSATRGDRPAFVLGARLPHRESGEDDTPLGVTWVYDEATGFWHEWGSLEGTVDAQELHQFRGTLPRLHRAPGGTGAAEKLQPRHFVGDRTTGKIYEMSFDFPDDDGTDIRYIRTTPHVAADNKRFFFSRLFLDREAGVADDEPTFTPRDIRRLRAHLEQPAHGNRRRDRRLPEARAVVALWAAHGAGYSASPSRAPITARGWEAEIEAKVGKLKQNSVESGFINAGCSARYRPPPTFASAPQSPCHLGSVYLFTGRPDYRRGDWRWHLLSTCRWSGSALGCGYGWNRPSGSRRVPQVAAGAQGPQGSCHWISGAKGRHGSHGRHRTTGSRREPQGSTGPQGPPATIQDEGVILTQRTTLNFVGAGVTRNR